MQGFADFTDSLLGGAVLIALAIALGGVAWGLVVLRPPGSAGRLEAQCRHGIVLGALAVAVLQGLALASKALVLVAYVGSPGLAAVLGTLSFRAGLARAVAALLLAAAAARLGPGRAKARWTAVVGSAVLLAASGAWLVHGAGRLEHRALLMTCTAVHQVAAAVWVGGLLYLAAAWRLGRRDPAVRAVWPELLARFSPLAAASVAALLVVSIPLVIEYVGSLGALVGTGYGSLLVTKMGLLAVALVLALGNRVAARRWRRWRDDAGARTDTPARVEVEGLLALVIVFVAVALASQPPGRDVVGDRATWREVVRVFEPKWPSLRTPSVATMQTDTSDPLVLAGGERTVAAYAWSNFSHNVAGLFLLGMSVLALLGGGRARGWTRHWPLGFVALAVFVFLRTSANDGVWPFGPRPFWAVTLADAEVLQHRLGALLVLGLGVVEWRARVRPGSRLPYVFPALAAVGAVLLLTHSHAAFETKSYYLIQVTHTAMGALAAILAGARLLELRLGEPRGRAAGMVAHAAMLLIALVLVFYQEANVVLPKI